MAEKNYFLLVARDELGALRELFSKNKLIFLFVLSVFIGGLYFIDPIPGKKILIATSGVDSAYALIAKDQQAYLSNQGIGLSIKETISSIQSAQLLAIADSGVNAAFIQGGVLDKALAQSIQSLGSVAYEPVWIFHQKGLEKRLDRFKDLAKLRVGTGPKESGTWVIARQLFALNNIDIDRSENFKADSYDNNLVDFLNGKLDVLINVNPQIDPVVNRLLHEPTAVIFELTHALAYDKNLPFVNVVTLPASSIDIANQIPPKDISLLATTTTLAVRKDMHDSLQMMLLMATKDAQRLTKNQFSSNEDKFPAYLDTTIPISKAATQYYDYGIPQTMRYLPFWLAGFIDRMWIFILSLFAILYPLSYLNMNLRAIRFKLSAEKIQRQLLEYEKCLGDKTLAKEAVASIAKSLDGLLISTRNQRVPMGCETAHFELISVLEDLRAKAG